MKPGEARVEAIEQLMEKGSEAGGPKRTASREQLMVKRRRPVADGRKPIEGN